VVPSPLTASLKVFAAAQLLDNVSDDVRQCIATKGRFRVCEHKANPAKDFQILAQCKYARACDRHTDSAEQVGGSRAYPKSERGAFCDYAGVFENEVFVDRAYTYEATSYNETAVAMARTNAHICPHLSTSWIAKRSWCNSSSVSTY
jgi:hypothetical protein